MLKDTRWGLGRNESTLRRIRVGDVIRYVAGPFGAVWRTNRKRTVPG